MTVFWPNIWLNDQIQGGANAPLCAPLRTPMVSDSIVPEQWKQAYIRPIQKIPIPTEPADYRPISITPVLSRLLEKLVVKQYFYPALLSSPPTLSFADQFAFHPGGSTTAALIALLRSITTMLRTNPYVVVFTLDFSKAFDTVRHSTFAEKLASLDMPDCVYNWVIFFPLRTFPSDCAGGRRIRLRIHHGQLYPGIRTWTGIVQRGRIRPSPSYWGEWNV